MNPFVNAPKAISTALLCALLFSARSQASQGCPAWRVDIPECPRSGTQVLPQNYPSLAYVVGDQIGERKAGQAKYFAGSVVLEILKNSGSRVPIIFVPADSDEQFNLVVSMVEGYIKEQEMLHPENYAEWEARQGVWLSAIVRSQSKNIDFPQDPFIVTFYDGKSGPGLGGVKPGAIAPAAFRQSDVATMSSADRDKRYYIDTLAAEANGVCPDMVKGSTLYSGYHPSYGGGSSGPPVSVFYGGDVSALPGGACIHGNDQPLSFSQQYCGSFDSNVAKSYDISIKTDFLRLSHVDEIFSVVRNPNKPAPCDFAIAIASPFKALEALRSAPNDHFTDFFTQGGNPGNLSYRLTEHSVATKTSGIATACEWVKKFKQRHPGPSPLLPLPALPEENGATSALVASLFGMIENAEADSFDCATITNGDVYQALMADIDGSGSANQLIQNAMTDAEGTIQTSIQAHLPACGKVDFIRIPQLFWGPGSYGKSLPKYQFESILPNGTNALVVNNGSVLTPHPQNKAFAASIQKQYDRLRIHNVFIDTMDYAHVADGNLHCATHSIPICRPSL